ncbi:MAG TPA: alpha/beta hydrolase [Gemmatimonadaceae bacterium]|nr:alpha/beta hydrolase [Gemmatimonadaceae bacterium]
MIDGFGWTRIEGDGAQIYAGHAGAGPPVLLLHGFPQSHIMWRDIAPRLAKHFTVVCADLRGYGDSTCPPSDNQHEPYAKRSMARDMVAVMAKLGFSRFALVGHDRGARVAYRLALDMPGTVSHLAVLDVIPSLDAWQRADARLALAFWPWTLLAQPAPLPERLIAGDPLAIVENAAAAWGSPAEVFPPDVLASYVAVLRDPDHVHAICEEYRAAALLDRTHDAADRAVGRRIVCPVLALWSGAGGLAQWYEAEGGPLGIWRQWADNVSGQAMPGGHFFPEEHPDLTAELLSRFLAG